MNDIELKNKTIEWLLVKDSEIKIRPRKFTPSEISGFVGGYPPSLGRVAKAVVLELVNNNVNIQYSNVGNKRYFEFL